MADTELLPCPFCGGDAQTDFIEGESYLIECYACRAETGIKDSEQETIEAWNRRAAPSPSTAPAGYAWLPLEPTEAMVHAAEDLPAPRMFGKVWRAMAGAALASRPAEVDDEGLPPLPSEAARAMKGEVVFFVKWQDAGKDLRGSLLLFTADQYRQGQRDAVAADRARRGAGGEAR